MYNDIFNRIEEKYFLDKNQKDKLFYEIRNYITKDKFYKSNILFCFLNKIFNLFCVF